MDGRTTNHSTALGFNLAKGQLSVNSYRSISIRYPPCEASIGGRRLSLFSFFLVATTKYLSYITSAYLKSVTVYRMARWQVFSKTSPDGGITSHHFSSLSPPCPPPVIITTCTSPPPLPSTKKQRQRQRQHYPISRNV